ncbi:HD-GYP domain-containing protein [Anoxynatronum buryatiense]|uniref:Stage 0 sporulation protein A homolog n=1 Tax=Anoxynatronum buryatiense TaxID=489973 RepID=A0AA45WY02_9CLOT|nr:HD domain-containing phosphohydrolase [Anoxynatronum buryatiense]SMP61437.1 putative two-component system response regulator [Anoxynatronum buryatiense]
MARILIVDDSKTDMIFISSMLEEHELFRAQDGIEAMEMLDRQPGIDLMILDLNMPRMNGFDVLLAMQQHPKYATVTTIILTNLEEVENEVKGLMLGAVDYIRKPLNIDALKKRIEVHLNVRNVRKNVEKHNRILEQMVMDRTRELMNTRDMTIRAFTRLLEFRHAETANHSGRIQELMGVLCRQVAVDPAFSTQLDPVRIMTLCQTAPLHDIGKAGLTDEALFVSETTSEKAVMTHQKHVTFGVEALREYLEKADDNAFLKTAVELIETHHEHYDGGGYPRGLAGEAIPLGGRILALVDAYDTAVCPADQEKAITHEAAVALIRSESGRQFDPAVVAAFEAVAEEFRRLTHGTEARFACRG